MLALSGSGGLEGHTTERGRALTLSFRDAPQTGTGRVLHDAPVRDAVGDGSELGASDEQLLDHELARLALKPGALSAALAPGAASAEPAPPPPPGGAPPPPPPQRAADEAARVLGFDVALCGARGRRAEHVLVTPHDLWRITRAPAVARALRRDANTEDGVRSATTRPTRALRSHERYGEALRFRAASHCGGLAVGVFRPSLGARGWRVFSHPLYRRADPDEGALISRDEVRVAGVSARARALALMPHLSQPPPDANRTRLRSRSSCRQLYELGLDNADPEAEGPAPRQLLSYAGDGADDGALAITEEGEAEDEEGEQDADEEDDEDAVIYGELNDGGGLIGADGYVRPRPGVVACSGALAIEAYVLGLDDDDDGAGGAVATGPDDAESRAFLALLAAVAAAEPTRACSARVRERCAGIVLFIFRSRADAEGSCCVCRARAASSNDSQAYGTILTRSPRRAAGPSSPGSAFTAQSRSSRGRSRTTRRHSAARASRAASSRMTTPRLRRTKSSWSASTYERHAQSGKIRDFSGDSKHEDWGRVRSSRPGRPGPRCAQ